MKKKVIRNPRSKIKYKFIKGARKLFWNSELKQLCFDVLKSYRKNQYKNILAKAGFVKLKFVGGSADVYESKKDKLILKIGGIFCPSERPPKRAVPTIVVIEYKRKVLHNFIRIQPVVKRTKKAIAIAKDFEEAHDGFGCDSHSGNLGLYKGEPVTFDW